MRICRVTEEGVTEEEDLVVTEEPLAIRIGYTERSGPEPERVTRDLVVTMRTPGKDLELALGFLFCEGIIQRASEVLSIRHCEEGGDGESRGNVVRVELEEGVEIAGAQFQRHSFMSSSCGVCGKTTLAAILAPVGPVVEGAAVCVLAQTVLGLSAEVRRRQRVFGVTGGIHAAALFTLEGELLDLAEDVGRHNAVDKLVGSALSKGVIPLGAHILFLSGRASFELLQKAAMAGVRMVCAIGSPSSLAIRVAGQFDITLVGFLREGRFNIYAKGQRVTVR